MLAPASKASWVLSICSETVIGTAGLLAFFGNDPVIATQMMQGSDIKEYRFVFALELYVKPVDSFAVLFPTARN